MMFMMIWIYQAVLMRLGVEIIYFGIVHALILSVQIFSLNNFEFFERLFGSRRKYVFISAFVPAIGLIVLSLTHWILPAIVLIVVIIGFGFPRRTLLENYMHKYIDSDKRATVISAVSMVRSGFQAICYPIMGWVVDWSLWFGIAILGIVILIVVLFSHVREEHLVD